MEDGQLMEARHAQTVTQELTVLLTPTKPLLAQMDLIAQAQDGFNAKDALQDTSVVQKLVRLMLVVLENTPMNFQQHVLSAQQVIHVQLPIHHLHLALTDGTLQLQDRLHVLNAQLVNTAQLQTVLQLTVQ